MPSASLLNIGGFSENKPETQSKFVMGIEGPLAAQRGAEFKEQRAHAGVAIEEFDAHIADGVKTRLVIDNSIFPDIYKPVEHWSQFLNCAWESFTARDHKFPRWTDGFTHVILTGSEASILEMDPWALEEAEWIREGLDRGLAFLGSCWGHQLLAYVLSGPGHVRRCASPEIGWIPIRVVAPGGPLGNPGTAFSFSLHFDEAVEMGPPFEVLAETDVCRIQAFQSRDGRILGLQIHPEINPRQGRRLLADLIRKGFTGADRMAEALESEPRDSGLAGRIVADFLEAGKNAATMNCP